MASTRIRRTKIIATLGPATDQPNKLAEVLKAGVNVVRLNFSHGDAAQQKTRAQRVRKLAAEQGKEVGIIADLQGPKIRIARFQKGSIELTQGQYFTLDASLDEQAGDDTQVGIDYKNLVNDVDVGDVLLINDGLIQLKVIVKKQSRIECEVLIGGELSNNKGINRLGGGLSVGALTEKDKQDILTIADMSVDYVAISFPRSAQEIEEVRTLLSQAGSTASIIAKIERQEALDALDDIILAADAVMVARGDLGVEIGDAELPGVQKHIIHQARNFNKVVITATQMMETMIHNPIPTRAEVFDVANAVLDGTDAVMLSAETATGKHPEKVVEAMARICLGAEKQSRVHKSSHRDNWFFDRPDEAIAMATMYTANHMQIKAIIALTESGSTPLLMSRIRSGIPIYALSRHLSTQRKMTLYRGVYPLYFDATQVERVAVNRIALDELQQLGLVNEGDLVIITKGDLMGVHGRTNALKILKV